MAEANLSTKAYGEEDNMTPEQVKQLVGDISSQVRNEGQNTENLKVVTGPQALHPEK
jgi:hypothetical protein